MGALDRILTRKFLFLHCSSPSVQFCARAVAIVSSRCCSLCPLFPSSPDLCHSGREVRLTALRRKLLACGAAPFQARLLLRLILLLVAARCRCDALRSNMQSERVELSRALSGSSDCSSAKQQSAPQHPSFIVALHFRCRSTRTAKENATIRAVGWLDGPRSHQLNWEHATR